MMQRMFEKKLDSAQCDGRSGARNLLLVCEKQKILPQILLGQEIRAPVIMTGELPDRSNIALLSPCGKAPQLHILYHPLTQLCHGQYPLSREVEAPWEGILRSTLEEKQSIEVWEVL